MFFFRRRSKIFDHVFPNSFLSRCGEISVQHSQGALLYGRGCSAGCEDSFDCHEVTASALSGHAGWCETILCTPLRIRWWQGLQPVLGVSWTLLLLLHDVGRTIATVIC